MPSDKRVQAPEAPRLVAQRVTATFKREAARRIHIQTEHEALVTTPEHPFATPDSGWLPAGRLVSGDRVVSARFGTVRVLSVQNGKAAQPQAVFNLTVDPSHTYLVGTDQVLAHNRKCKDPAEREKEIEDAERERDELQRKLTVAAAEDKAALKQQLDQVRRQIVKLKDQARAARRRKAQTESEPNRPAPEVAPASEARNSGGLARTIRALDDAIEAIKKGTTAGSPQRLAELRQKRKTLKNNLAAQRVREKKKLGIACVPLRERLLRDSETDYESRRQQLEAAQRELSALLGENPQSGPERKSQAERRAALEKSIKTLQLEHDASKEILVGERRIVELTGRVPSTDAERQEIAEARRELTDMLSKKRVERLRRERYRRVRDDPASYEEVIRTNRELDRKRLRRPAYVGDMERPRDTLELLEEELAARRRESGSASHEERTEYLTERIETLKAIVELSRQRERLNSKLVGARKKRAELSGAGRDTKEIDQEIARLKQEQRAGRIRAVQLRLREAVLGRLDGTTSAEAPNEVDEARLRELERELERELAEGGDPEERLREIQHELGEPELIDADFLEGIWREAEAEEAAIQETVQDEAEDVDALLRALAESAGTSPSPERTAAVETGLQALQRELREERSAVEAADFELANLHAFLSQTLARPGSSQHAPGAQRIAEVEQQRMQLRIDWRTRMQRRLDAARQELRTLQSIDRFRDEAAEAELGRRIALLEHEVNNPSF